MTQKLACIGPEQVVARSLVQSRFSLQFNFFHFFHFILFFSMFDAPGLLNSAFPTDEFVHENSITLLFFVLSTFNMNVMSSDSAIPFWHSFLMLLNYALQSCKISKQQKKKKDIV